MRKSKADAALTRQQIVTSAADEFRLNGITATGIVPLMSGVGLTQGGFYKHFESKDQLVAEACAAALDALVAKFETTAQASGDAGFAAIIESYLSADHRANKAQGCPLAAMGSELVRAGEETRQAASQGFNDLVEVMKSSLIRSGKEEPRSQAVFAMAAMVGALTMSRILPDEVAAASVLEDVKHHLSLI
ncbi:TetR family transcriptional regulator [Herbaspirillum huttiense]|uniref:TetR/AcrR family transcriptional regulator n=1 Tax=Herbaspirillum huttiense TaxID=863372 RepID=UPI0039B0EC78